MSEIVQRGNTVFLSFTFEDQNDAAVTVTSAGVQLFYPGRDLYQTENIALTGVDGVWSGTWDSTKARASWVRYLAYAVAEAGDYAQGGRFKVEANAASYQRDLLPVTGAGLNDPPQADYS